MTDVSWYHHSEGTDEYSDPMAPTHSFFVTPKPPKFLAIQWDGTPRTVDEFQMNAEFSGFFESVEVTDRGSLVLRPYQWTDPPPPPVVVPANHYFVVLRKATGEPDFRVLRELSSYDILPGEHRVYMTSWHPERPPVIPPPEDPPPEEPPL